MQLFKDYKDKKKSDKLGDVSVITKGKWNLADINELFSSEIMKLLKRVLLILGLK